MSVTLYSRKEGCRPCKSTKRELDKAGIKYDLVIIDDNQDAVDTIHELGYATAPVVFIDNDTHWAGYRPSDIANLALTHGAQAENAPETVEVVESHEGFDIISTVTK